MSAHGQSQSKRLLKQSQTAGFPKTIGQAPNLVLREYHLPFNASRWPSFFRYRKGGKRERNLILTFLKMGDHFPQIEEFQGMRIRPRNMERAGKSLASSKNTGSAHSYKNNMHFPLKATKLKPQAPAAFICWISNQHLIFFVFPPHSISRNFFFLFRREK